MSDSINSSEGVIYIYIGDYIGDYFGFRKGETGILGYSSYDNCGVLSIGVGGTKAPVLARLGG